MSSPNSSRTFGLRSSVKGLISHRSPVYQCQEDVEDLERYRAGGYHPVQINDEYSQGRYRIVHKLDWGSYSTVWLTRDLQLNRYVALKIVVAEASKTSSESRILRHLGQHLEGSLYGKQSVSCLLDEFTISGPNGQHLCLSSEPAGCSIADSKEASNKFMFPMDIARAIAAQAILILQTIHSSGVVHGGKLILRSLGQRLNIADLHTMNILFTLPQIHSLSVEEIYERFGKPHETPVEKIDGTCLGPEAPPCSVWPMMLYIASDKVTNPQIQISDFGEAWLQQDAQSKEDLRAPVTFLPPETTFAKDLLGFPADIWTLACSIYEIMGERPLFEGLFPDRDDIISEMVSTLGLLPRHWWDTWSAREEFFNEDGSWKTDMKRHYDAKSRPLLLRVQQNGRQKDPEFTDAEIESLTKMLRSMLEYDPLKRATAEELVKCEWMRERGLPAMKRHGNLKG